MNIKKTIAVLLSACLLLTGCSEKETEPEAQAQINEEPVKVISAREIAESMSLEEKIGQMIIPAFRTYTESGAEKLHKVTELNSEISDAISGLNLGGVILFAENCLNTEQIVKLTHDMQLSAERSRNGIPLFIGIDQEGGWITRLPVGCTTSGNMAIGATQDALCAYDNAWVIGKELSSLGINVDFAPCLDVNSNPENPVIGIRSFSSDPEIAATMGESFINGMHASNVATCAKHFSGHGDTDTDSHTGLPCIYKSLEDGTYCFP